MSLLVWYAFCVLQVLAMQIQDMNVNQQSK